MKNLITKNKLFYTLMLYALTSTVIMSATAFSQQQEIPENVRKDWDALTKDGGVWITHDNVGSFDAYGMKFTWGLGKKTVDGILYVIKDGKNTDTLFEYKLYYHPTEKKIILEQYGSDGTVGLGEVVTFENLKSQNISTFYNPDGSVFKLKHVQEYKGDIKTSQTFLIDSTGQWAKARYYEWKRLKTQTSMALNLTFDHQALFVRNLDTSARFYSEILHLKELENKTKNPIVRWFSLGNGTELHLISGDNRGIVLKKAVHFALSVSDLDGFLKHLDQKKINYADWPGEKRSPNVQADGVLQVYLQDPDGYWIEINDAKHE